MQQAVRLNVVSAGNFRNDSGDRRGQLEQQHHDSFKREPGAPSCHLGCLVGDALCSLSGGSSGGLRDIMESQQSFTVASGVSLVLGILLVRSKTCLNCFSDAVVAVVLLCPS